MKSNELKTIIENHAKWLEDNSKGERANFSGVNLSRANLSGVNLSKANLSKANLSKANLSRANLSRANLSGVNLSKAILSHANFSHANLRYANLSGADLSGANLSGVNLNYANLRYANLTDANLNNIKAWNTIGNRKEIKSTKTEKYIINIINGKMVQIGCKQHSFDDWMNFGDKTIDQMDHSALEWWKTWKPKLKVLVDKSK